MDNAAITTVGLTKLYRGKAAVDNLDLVVPEGGVFGFLGPNGAGKTTTIRMLLGLVSPSAGSAYIGRRDVVRDRRYIAREVGAIVESPSFYGYLTAQENIAIAALTSGVRVSTAEINNCLCRAGLDSAKGAVSKFSLGMRQRLGIASVLVTKPKLIFLDEPTNGLDPAGTVEMRDLVSGLAAGGATVFLTSHLLSEVEQVCSQAAILKSGKLIWQGDVASLTTGRRDTFVMRVDDAARAHAACRDIPDVEAATEGAATLVLKCESGAISEIIQRLVQHGVEIRDMRQRSASLEDAFLELTGSGTSTRP